MIGWFKKDPPPTVKKRFTPQQDITTYQLAYILSKVNGPLSYGIMFTEEKWANFPYKRHFMDYEELK